MFFQQKLWTPAILFFLLLLLGCGRAHYRQQADREVYDLVQRGKDIDTRWQLHDYSVQPKRGTRLFDITSPDRPPLPPDDPLSHRLMHCVDDKKGYKKWHANGDQLEVDNGQWQRCLPRDEEGKVHLDRTTAMQLALLHSRDYQREIEDLYLSALDVTFQRYRFDAQFFGGHSTFFTADGPLRSGNSQSVLQVDHYLRMQKLFATGGELAVGLANSLVWQFAGPDEYSASSLIDFSFMQPLLRNAGRAVVLENLTQSERTLLANLRQLERYQQGFYLQTIAGDLPHARSPPWKTRYRPPPLSTSGGIGGFLAILQDQVRIRNQTLNVSGLRNSLDQLEAAYDAGRIDNFQVDLARQALFNAQSSLLALRSTFQDRIDAYLFSLGLPPNLEVKVEDPLLKQFDLIDPKITNLREKIASVLTILRETDAEIHSLAEWKTMLLESEEVVAQVEDDFARLQNILPKRKEILKHLASKEIYSGGDMDASALSVAFLDRKVNNISIDFNRQGTQMRSAIAALVAYGESIAENKNLIERKKLLQLLGDLNMAVSELTLTQARCRLESIVLLPLEMNPVEALNVARRNRLDWMNARAALVDSWRQIEIAADQLEGDLNVTFSGDMGTVGNNPLQFRSTTGRLRVGLQFDAPLNRLAERNLYRETLINYQQMRRAYMAFADRVQQSLRSDLRTIERYQFDFELRRAGVNVAINQVDVMQLRLQRPPKVGETTIFGATTARDLVQALQGLLSAENNFLAGWVEYQVLRMNLDFDLGTFRLNECGEWIDAGGILNDVPASQEDALPEVIPLPDPLPEEPALPAAAVNIPQVP